MIYKHEISSPIGTLYLLASDTGLVSIDNKISQQYLQTESRPQHPIFKTAELELKAYFKGELQHFSVPLDVQNGTVFQRAAWKALLDIPYGAVWTYKLQAEYLGNPKATRAVGAANGANPLPIIIPCHRVIGANGLLTGYSCGMEMKIALLKLEGHQCDGLKLS